MKLKPYIFLITLIIICHFMLIGCAGTVQPYVPESLQKTSPGKARIVLTRQSQLGLSGQYVFFDIGENIKPNALLSGRISGGSVAPDSIITQVPDGTSNFRGVDMALPNTPGIKLKEAGNPLEDMVKEDKTEFLFIDLLWCDSKTIRAISCGNQKQACECSCDKGFIVGDIALVWESGIALGMKGDFYGHIVKSSKDSSKADLPIELANYLESFNMAPIVNGDMEKVTIINEKEGFKIPAANATLAFTNNLSNPLFKGDPGSWETANKYAYIISNRHVYRNIEVVGSLYPKNTVVWERDPGVMRLGAICENIRYGSTFSPHNIQVEAGKTYYIDFQVKAARGAFWTLVKTE